MSNVSPRTSEFLQSMHDVLTAPVPDPDGDPVLAAIDAEHARVSTPVDPAIMAWVRGRHARYAATVERNHAAHALERIRVDVDADRKARAERDAIRERLHHEQTLGVYDELRRLMPDLDRDRGDLLVDVLAEMHRQDKAYDTFEPTVKSVRLALAVLADELHEAERAWRKERRTATWHESDWPRVRGEVLQVAAIALRLVRAVTRL